MTEKIEWVRSELSRRWTGVKSPSKKREIAKQVWKEAKSKFN